MKKISNKKNQEESLEELKIDVGLQILELRLLTNKTQGALAKMIGTQQPSIARAERGATIPSLDFLNKIAVALGTYLIPPKFALVNSHEIRYQSEKADFAFRQSSLSSHMQISDISDQRVSIISGTSTAETALITS